MSAWLHIITHPVYLLTCLLVGVAGRKRQVGFFGFALLSVLLTPIVTLFALYVGGEKRRAPLEDE